MQVHDKAKSASRRQKSHAAQTLRSSGPKHDDQQQNTGHAKILKGEGETKMQGGQGKDARGGGGASQRCKGGRAKAKTGLTQSCRKATASCQLLHNAAHNLWPVGADGSI